MAYMNQEKKAKIAVKVKEILKKYGMKGSLSFHHHSGLTLTLRGEALFQDGAYTQVNTYHIDKNHFGEEKDFLLEVHEAMMEGNHDNSDIQSDYFDVGWYVYISVGKWNKISWWRADEIPC